jgi:hypothetical protein
MPFTIGMRAADRASDAPTAFLWGVNGATSVCASVFGLVFSIFLGISVAFWTGTLAYAVALIAMTVIIRRPPVGGHATDDRDLAVHVLERTARDLSPSASRTTSVVRPGDPPTLMERQPNREP